MVVMAAADSSGLTFPPISDVVFVMEESAATALYLTSEMRDNYIVPTLEHFGTVHLLFLSSSSCDSFSLINIYLDCTKFVAM